MNIEHVTEDEWSTECGTNENTQITLRRERHGKTLKLVICDHVDPHCKFWIYGDLSRLKKFVGAIGELIKQAEKT